MSETKQFSFASIRDEGWRRTDTICYSFAPLGDVEQCSISLLIQTEKYSYENIAIDITISQDSALLYHELCNYVLTQGLSKRGIGRRYDYMHPIGYFTLCDTLPTTITLVQCLDQFPLKGIHKVGVCIDSSLQ